MNIDDYPSSERLEALARRAGMERSLYLGEAIGNVLAIAWEALGGLGHSISGLKSRRRLTLRPRFDAAPTRAGAGE